MVLLTGVRRKSEFSLLRCDHGSNFQNFDLKRLRTFTPTIPKVSFHNLLPILAAQGRKFRFGLFYRGATKWVKFPNFFSGDSISDLNLTPVVQSFPPGFFTHFGRPISKNFDSVFLTKVRPMGQISKFYKFSAIGRPKWVKNLGGKLSGPLA